MEKLFSGMGLFGGRIASVTTSSLVSLGTALRRPVRAMLAGRTQEGSSTLPVLKLKRTP